MKKYNLFIMIMMLSLSLPLLGQSLFHPWSVTDAGGGKSTGGGLTLSASTGQTGVQVMSGGGLNIEGGFMPITRSVLSTSSVVGINMLNSWNLVSVPLAVSDYRKTILFPTATSSAFAYFPPPTGYAPKETLKTGVGYWLKFPFAQGVLIEGTPRAADTLNVSAGWNMIGTISSPARTVFVTPIPPVAIQSSFFGFEGVLGYLTEDTLKPGKGYWVKVNQAGQIVIRTASIDPSSKYSSLSKSNPATAGGKNTLSDIAEKEGLSKIGWKDNAGQERYLYFSSTRKKIELDKFELPPQPPSGIFDVRFKSQRSVETASAAVSDAAQEFPISISGAEFPLAISWDVLKEDEQACLHGSSCRQAVLELLGAGDKPKQIPLNETGEVVVDDNNILAVTLKLTSSKVNEIPKEFALHQNYPNPFNPATTIKYDLPKDAWVTLKIYNALGQEVATLVDEMQEAGYRTIVWDANNSPSGVYMYRINAGGITQVHRMVLIK